MPTDQITIYPDRELAAAVRDMAKTDDRKVANMFIVLTKEALAARAAANKKAGAL